MIFSELRNMNHTISFPCSQFPWRRARVWIFINTEESPNKLCLSLYYISLLIFELRSMCHLGNRWCSNKTNEVVLPRLDFKGAGKLLGISILPSTEFLRTPSTMLEIKVSTFQAHPTGHGALSKFTLWDTWLL